MRKTTTKSLKPHMDGMIDKFNRIILNNLSLFVSRNSKIGTRSYLCFCWHIAMLTMKLSATPSQMSFRHVLHQPYDRLFRRQMGFHRHGGGGGIIRNLQAWFEELCETLDKCCASSLSIYSIHIFNIQFIFTI